MSPCLALLNSSSFHLLPALGCWHQLTPCEVPDSPCRPLLQACTSQKCCEVRLDQQQPVSCVPLLPAHRLAYLHESSSESQAFACLLFFLRKFSSQRLDFTVLALCPLFVPSLSIQKC